MELGKARTPEGTRLYAIGDVHGMDRMLSDAHGRIAADLESRPAADHRIIHVGDYVDRGPDSAAVIDRLAGLAANDRRTAFLMGNHDELMLGFLSEPMLCGPNWLANGAGTTLASYGITPPDSPDFADLPDLSARLGAAMPASHRDFLRGLGRSIRFGDFFFCHAGIRPGVPLERQSGQDLSWIREPFLSSTRDHGAVIVHGHTPVKAPEVRSNRIDVDTGAVYGGPLTVLALEGTDYRFL